MISPTIHSVACSVFSCHLLTPILSCHYTSSHSLLSCHNPLFSRSHRLTFLTHLLICLPVYTMAHFHSLPLPDCLVCFSPSFPAFVVPAWKLLAALCTFCSIMHLPRKWFECFKCSSASKWFYSYCARSAFVYNKHMQNDHTMSLHTTEMLVLYVSYILHLPFLQ